MMVNPNMYGRPERQKAKVVGHITCPCCGLNISQKIVYNPQHITIIKKELNKK